MQRVLVVEDEVPVARALERWLRRQGVEVCIVHNPLEVERALETFAPTLVVSDLNMPGRDGIEVQKVVKRLAPDAKRALLSGSLDSLNPARLDDVKPIRLVNKPWRDETLAVDLGLVPA